MRENIYTTWLKNRRVLGFLIAITLTGLPVFFSGPSAAADGGVFSASEAQQKPADADKAQILAAVNTIFVAMAVDDVAKFDSVVASDFYLFDGGARFPGNSIVALIKAQHDAGKTYQWNVTEPDIHISGGAAWIAYVNDGSVADASGTKKQKWPESAFLQRQDGVWKIMFMHSTRAPGT